MSHPAFLFLLSSAYMVMSHSTSKLSRQINLFLMLRQQLVEWSSPFVLKAAEKLEP